MEALLGYSRILPFETFIAIIGLTGLVLLFFVRAVESASNGLLGGSKRVLLDEKVANMHNSLIDRLIGGVRVGSRIPRSFAEGLIHSGALIALSGLRALERVLKKVIDAVRGRRDFSTTTPPSSAFLQHIMPKRRSSDQSGPMGQ